LQAAVHPYPMPGLRSRIRLSTRMIKTSRHDRNDAIRLRDRNQVDGERVYGVWVREVGISHSGRGCSGEGGKMQRPRSWSSCLRVDRMQKRVWLTIVTQSMVNKEFGRDLTEVQMKCS
jgi:hypothetical protein